MSSSTRVSLEYDDRCPSILLAAASSEVEDTIHARLASHYRIINTDSSREILGLVKAGEFECVLIDMARSADDTNDLLRRLKRQASELPVLVMCSSPEISAGVEAVRAGAADFIIKDVEFAGLSKRIAKLIGRAPATRKCSRRSPGSDHQWSPGKMVVGSSHGMREVMALARKAAKYRVNVLITGESGTGKELLAQWIHQRSVGSEGPFVAVNLAAIPSDLVESTLFGHEKGAFTGATGKRVGKFAQAQGGSLLLDEITELRLDLQPKLLRVLQESEFDRVGGDRTIRSDARVLAISNHDMAEQVQCGKFRSDLFYRLNIVAFRLPPLRERREDILELAGVFLDKYNRLYNCAVSGFAPEAKELLMSYDWPGNIRELENAVQRAVICVEEGELGVDGCFDFVDYATDRAASQMSLQSGTLEEIEQRYIVEVLQRSGGHQGNAAKILGIDRKTLYNKILKFGLGRSLNSEEQLLTDRGTDHRQRRLGAIGE